MKRLKIYVVIFSFLISFEASSQAFTPGNVVVCRIGNGTSSITGDLTVPVFLDEYTPSGTFVRTIAMPTTSVGTNRGITMWGGTRNIMGMMTLSADKQYLAIAGYDAPAGSDANVILLSTPVPARVIGLIKYDGQVNTTTAVTNWSDNNAFNAAVTTNGIDIWCAGQGTINGGIRYTSLGAATSTQVAGTPTALRTISIQNGQLYTSVGDVFAVGSGIPITSGQTTTALGLGSGSKNQFYLADLNPLIAGPDVLYLADQTNGLRKFSLIAGVWTLNGTIGAGADSYKGLTAIVNGNSVTLFATRKGANATSIGGGDLVSITDNTGYNGAFGGTPAVLSTVPTDMASFRGVALAPVQAPACPVPSSLAAFNITPSGAQFQWNAVNGSAGYQYALTTTPTPPLSGTPITTPFYTATGLSQGQTYYFHVRTDCGNFTNSSWSTVSFVAACSAPPVPAIRNVGYTEEVTWLPVYGASGYEYALSSGATPPSSGTPTTDTGFTITSLASVTHYYIHVRTKCAPGVYSAWTTTGFTTPCLGPVVSSTVSGDDYQFTWNRVNEGGGYEYALTNYPTPPLGGTPVGDTSIHFPGLDGGTTYYFHVRTKCTKGNGLSPWTTVRFQTTGLDAYPNPVSNTLTIKIYGLAVPKGQVVISDVMGRVVKQLTLTNNSVDVNVMDLASGVYLVTYRDGTTKFMVKVLKN
jgi:hypothetical protein